jgi:hypothetical protein
MDDVALGVKVFTRADQLQGLLESVAETEIPTVYIADDGEMTEKKAEIYSTEYSFETVVLDLDYDVGLGYGRREIVENLDEEFLLIVDTDHRVPENISVLRDQMVQRPEIGGISGLLYEHGEITAVCHDLYERGGILLRDKKSRKQVEMVAGYPLVQFDFIPNVAMFRRECVTEYCWDPEYVIGKEHLDFYVGHMKNTDWEFAINPSVLFDHYPDSGGSDYERNRQSIEKLSNTKRYFLEKWGYSGIVLGQTDWINSANTQLYSRDSVVENVIKYVLLEMPPSVQSAVMRLRDRRRKQKGRAPL